MRSIKTWMLGLLSAGMVTAAMANINPNISNRPASNQANNSVNFRNNCDNAIRSVDQSVNNVRARLTTGGDVWWDGRDGRYVVPKVPAGIPEVSSIFAGAVWLGGVDDAGNLKLAAQTYGRSSGRFDFWPGPLIPDGPDQGTTIKETCAQWDRFFTVTANDIDEHIRNYTAALEAGTDYDPVLIPRSVRGWPAKGNRFFFAVHQFELPNTSQGLAGFFDQDGNGDYDPERGDYPIIEIRGCPEPQYADEMTFWIYNDAGNIHAQTQGDKIQMEVQVQAFAYATNDDINNMTFQRYKLINRAIESIDSMFFAMWVDPDLGCYTDDYVGCDTLRSLAYVYNEDAIDGTTGCSCEGGVNTYCDKVPILGVDYFRGPLDENGQELGMSSFVYYNNGGIAGTVAGTADPGNALEYYRYLSGSWRDGSPFVFGGNGYQSGGAPVQYAFPSAPNDPNGWSMVTEALPFGDRRTVQASGPFRLDPGAVNELIIGAVWIPDQPHPAPSIRKLQEVDDIAQALFDNCFNITNGPDAPDLDFIELDQEIVMILTNASNSNNFEEGYAEPGLEIPGLETDSLYLFEGYQIYQFANAEVGFSTAELEDPSRARLVAQVDIKNGVGRLFNWASLEPGDVPSTIEDEIFVPRLQVDGADQGIRHTFQFKEDQFATADRRLINHKKYYYGAVAYAYNNYADFDPVEVVGQRKPYLAGRRNLGPNNDGQPYTVIPRPVVDQKLNAIYGDGAVITRLDGIGNGGSFLDISDETRKIIEDKIKANEQYQGEITYRPGQGPIEVKIYNPIDVKDGVFELTFVDNNMANAVLDAPVTWRIRNVSDATAPVITSDRPIESLNEQILKEFGFSVTIGQVAAPGDPKADRNGVVGYGVEYANTDAAAWVSGVPDDFKPGDNFFDNSIFNYLKTDFGEVDEILDPNKDLSRFGPGIFSPYYLADWRPPGELGLPYITPAWTSSGNSNNIVRGNNGLFNLNNVDIVMTSDKSLWSRCVVVESANLAYEQTGFLTVGGAKHFDVRRSPSVTKMDSNNDGKPDEDTAEPRRGFGWFPGYAIDVETGQRLNIFFGENSTYNGDFFPESYFETPRGADMMFNPTSQMKIVTQPGPFGNLYDYYAGGQHFVYVSNSAYDGCEAIYTRFSATSALQKVQELRKVTWAGLIMPRAGEGSAFKSYADGLIPNDVIVKLRVTSPYRVRVGTNAFNGYPTYQFALTDKASSSLDAVGVNEALEAIRVVPNPYYGFADYESSQFETVVKITNLPAKCVVNIYTLDGKFIRRYNRDELPGAPKGSAIERRQITPDLDWDLRNSKGIPVASGVYLIHVQADGLGERTIKWFGVNRQFDPSGL